MSLAPLPVTDLSTFAHVVGGVVVEVLLLPADIDHASVMVDPASSLVPCNVSVGQGWTTTDSGKTFAAPVVVSAAPGPRLATTYALMSALTDAQWAAYPGAKPTDQRLFGARDTPWPEDNAKVARISTVLGTTPKAWFDAALNAT